MLLFKTNYARFIFTPAMPSLILFSVHKFRIVVSSLKYWKVCVCVIYWPPWPPQSIPNPDIRFLVDIYPFFHPFDITDDVTVHQNHFKLPIKPAPK